MLSGMPHQQPGSARSSSAVQRFAERAACLHARMFEVLPQVRKRRLLLSQQSLHRGAPRVRR